MKRVTNDEPTFYLTDRALSNSDGFFKRTVQKIADFDVLIAWVAAQLEQGRLIEVLKSVFVEEWRLGGIMDVSTNSFVSVKHPEGNEACPFVERIWHLRPISSSLFAC